MKGKQDRTDLRTNRRQLLKRAGAVGALAALLSPTAAFAQPATNTREGPEGSWMVTITVTSGPPLPPFQALYTYAAGGGLVQTEQPAANPQAPESPAHGAWVSTGEGTFASTLLNFTFDSKGNPTGTVKVREMASLNEQGEAYAGSGKFDIFDRNGNEIVSGRFTSQGTRIHVEPV